MASVSEIRVVGDDSSDGDSKRGNERQLTTHSPGQITDLTTSSDTFRIIKQKFILTGRIMNISTRMTQTFWQLVPGFQPRC